LSAAAAISADTPDTSLPITTATRGGTRSGGSPAAPGSGDSRSASGERCVAQTA
jgi:hypothetical protein